MKRKNNNCSNCNSDDTKTLPVGPRKKLLCLECAKLPEFLPTVVKNVKERRRRRGET